MVHVVGLSSAQQLYANTPARSSERPSSSTVVMPVCSHMVDSSSGGIGRHKGLKIPRRQRRAGSIPASSTILMYQPLALRIAWNPRWYIFARFVYRFRTLAFHVSKTGSIPVPCTSFCGQGCNGVPGCLNRRYGYGFLALVRIQLAAPVFIGRAAARLALKRPVELPGVP